MTKRGETTLLSHVSCDRSGVAHTLRAQMHFVDSHEPLQRAGAHKKQMSYNISGCSLVPFILNS